MSKSIRMLGEKPAKRKLDKASASSLTSRGTQFKFRSRPLVSSCAAASVAMRQRGWEVVSALPNTLDDTCESVWAETVTLESQRSPLLGVRPERDDANDRREQLEGRDGLEGEAAVEGPWGRLRTEAEGEPLRLRLVDVAVRQVEGLPPAHSHVIPLGLRVHPEEGLRLVHNSPARGRTPRLQTGVQPPHGGECKGRNDDLPSLRVQVDERVEGGEEGAIPRQDAVAELHPADRLLQNVHLNGAVHDVLSQEAQDPRRPSLRDPQGLFAQVHLQPDPAEDEAVRDLAPRERDAERAEEQQGIDNALHPVATA